MTTGKLIDKNRRVHSAKTLAEIDKKKKKNTASNKVQYKENNSLDGQYQLIRKDVIKLKKDLAHGYGLLKEWVETKFSIRTYFGMKENESKSSL